MVGCAKKLIIKSMFQNKTFFLQSSKVVTFWETSKKSWLLEKICAKKFHFNAFCPYFCPLKSVQKRLCRLNSRE